MIIKKKFLFDGTPFDLAIAAVACGDDLLTKDRVNDMPYNILPRTWGADKDIRHIIIELIPNDPNLPNGELRASIVRGQTLVEGLFQSEDWELFCRERYDWLYNELAGNGRIALPNEPPPTQAGIIESTDALMDLHQIKVASQNQSGGITAQNLIVQGDFHQTIHEPTTKQEPSTAGEHQAEIFSSEQGIRRRILGLRIGYLIAGVVLGICISVASWFVFPDWSRSNFLWLILFPIAFAVATNFIANFRKAYE